MNNNVEEARQRVIAAAANLSNAQDGGLDHENAGAESANALRTFDEAVEAYAVFLKDKSNPDGWLGGDNRHGLTTVGKRRNSPPEPGTPPPDRPRGAGESRR